MDKASIVILNWNGRAHLERFLGSVVRNTPAEYPVIVADNGSTDDSLEWLRAAYPRVGIITLDRNYGFAGGYNRALAQVESQYYILVNSDVETPEGWCQPLIESLDSNPDLGAVAPKLKSVDHTDRFEYAGASGGFIDILGYPFCRGRILDNIECDRGQYDTPRHVFWASGAAFACRAEAFKKCGGFDEDFFAHMEEIDLCWRMQEAGYRIGVEPRSTVFHLGGGTLDSSSPRKTLLNHRNNLSMLFKNMPAGYLWWVLPLRLVLDGVTAATYAMRGRWRHVAAVWQAHCGFYRQTGSLRAKRREIRRNRPPLPATVYRGSIVIRYMLGRRSFGDMMAEHFTPRSGAAKQ